MNMNEIIRIFDKILIGDWFRVFVVYRNDLDLKNTTQLTSDMNCWPRSIKLSY